MACVVLPCLFVSHYKQASEAVPVTDKPLHATEKLAAFLICAWIQLKGLWSCLAAGVSTGCLTTTKSLINVQYIDYLG